MEGVYTTAAAKRVTTGPPAFPVVFNISQGKKEILVRQAAINERSWSPNVEKAKGKIPLNPDDYRSKSIFEREIKDY